MSWLGNSLNSITGHLSNFTKEVLIEGREEVSDHGAELSIARTRVRELEIQCNAQRQELDRLRLGNRELEERCQASDLQLASLTSQYRELQRSNNLKVQETIQTDAANSPVGDQNAIGRSEAQNEELFRQLQDAAEQHHQQMSALQDHHDERLSQLQNSYQQRLQTLERQLQLFQGDRNDEGTPSSDDNQVLRHRLSELESQLTNVRQQADETESQFRNKEKQISLLNRQLEKLQTEKLQKSPKIERKEEYQSKRNDLTDSTSQTENREEIQELKRELVDQIKNLEEQLFLKDDEIRDLSTEKQSLDSSLVELDGQHQEEINAVLVVKEELSAANKIIVSNLEEAKRQNEALEVKINNLKEQLANSRVKTEENQMKTLSNQLNEINLENQRLEEKLKQSDDEVARMGREALNQEENYLREKEQLEKDLSEVKLRVKELESIVLEKDDGGATNTAEFISGNTNANTIIQQMSSENENLQNEADDLRTKLRANAREIDLLKLEIDSLKVENENLREQLEQRNAVVEGLEDSLEQTEKSHAKQIAENEEQVLGLREKLDCLAKEDGQSKMVSVNTSSQINSSQTDTQISISATSQTDELNHPNENEDILKKQEILISSLKEELLRSGETNLQNCHVKDNEIIELRGQLNDLTQKVEESSTLKSNLLKEVSENEELIVQKNNNISNLEEEVQSHFEKLKRQTDLKEKLESDQLVLLEELEKLKERAKKSEELSEELTSELNTLRSLVENTEISSLQEKQDWDQPEKNFHDKNNILQQKDSEIRSLNSKIESLLSSQKFSTESSSTDDLDKNSSDRIKSLESEKERLLTVLNEKSRECSSLKAEVHRLFGVVSAEKQALLKLQQDNMDLSHQKSNETEKEMTKEAVHNLARIIKDKDLEIESLKQKSETLLAVMHQTQPGSNDNVHLEKLMSEKEELMKQVQSYQNDREQITRLLNQKHQESLSYHAEMQKLNSQLIIEKENYRSLKEQHQSVSLLFEEKQKSLINTQNEVVSLKQRVTELERNHTDLSSKYSSIVDKTSETIQINRDEFIAKQQILEELQSKIKQCEELINEKDRMIYQLNHSLEETSVILSRKEETLKTLQHRLDDVSFKFSEAEMKLKETVEEGASSSDDLQKLRMENEALHEETKSLTMSLKQSQFEKESMKEKIATLVQLVQEKDAKNNESTESGRSASSAQLLQDFVVLEEKMGVITLERDQALLALSQQQQENRNQQREQKKFQDQNEKLHSELDRLRNHLLEIQDNYTQEIISAEDREKALRIKLASAEDRASLSTNAIANASLESQNRVDSLQQQLSQVMRQRDFTLEQNSRLEDQIQQLKAAITNLQSALECIQGDHRRELIEAARASQEKIRLKEKDIDILKSRVSERDERLKETIEALDAASRLSEQLDRKEQLINELRNEVTEKQRLLSKSMDEIKELEMHTEGKVDKQIMKSLVLGYLSAPVHQKPEVVRLLARILDFNQIEMEKAGLKIGREKTPARLMTPNRGGWISNIIGKVVPTPTPPPQENKPTSSPSSPSVSSPNQSFSTLFVEFLTNESQPNVPARMPLETFGLNNSRIPSKSSVNLDFYSPMNNKSLVTASVSNQHEHPLMRPLSTALPTFTPVLSGDSPPNKTSQFLEDVLK